MATTDFYAFFHPIPKFNQRTVNYLLLNKRARVRNRLLQVFQISGLLTVDEGLEIAPLNCKWQGVGSPAGHSVGPRGPQRSHPAIQRTVRAKWGGAPSCIKISSSICGWARPRYAGRKNRSTFAGKLSPVTATSKKNGPIRPPLQIGGGHIEHLP